MLKTNQSDHKHSRSVPTNTCIHRGYLSGLSGIPFGTPLLDSRYREKYTLTKDLLVNPDLLPEEFTTVDDTDDIPLFNYHHFSENNPNATVVRQPRHPLTNNSNDTHRVR